MSGPEFFSNHDENYSLDNNADHFAVDDLLDIPKEENDEDQKQEAINVVDNEGVHVIEKVNNVLGNSIDNTLIFGNSTDSNTLSGLNHNSKDVQFAGDLFIPQDDLADQLEWVSTFQEDTFSSEELLRLQFLSGIAPQSSNSEHATLQLKPNQENNNDSNKNSPKLDSNVRPAKPRSKRPRFAPDDWTSRLFPVSDTQEIVIPTKPPPPHVQRKKATKRKENYGDNNVGRKCLHCATDKTPQWRSGPLGPKTLCNACGVRYKSGRLVPEYRPAASPTFTLTKHSNSHRKVMELRRQNELKAQTTQHMRQHQQHQQLVPYEQHQGMVFNMSNSDDYLIHQHLGVDFPGFLL